MSASAASAASATAASGEQALEERVKQLEAELQKQRAAAASGAAVDVDEEDVEGTKKETGISMQHLAIAAAVLIVFGLIAKDSPSKGTATSGIIILCSASAFAFAMYWWKVAEEIIIEPGKGIAATSQFLTTEIMENVVIISKRVSDGATAFLFAEYRYMAAFMGGFGILLYILLGVSLSNPTDPAAGIPNSPWTNAGLSV